MSPLAYMGITFIGGGLALAARALFVEVKNPAGALMGAGAMFLIGLGLMALHRFLKRRSG